MQKLPKIIIVTFALYMLLCIPALAAQQVGGFVSNTPTAAGPNASIGEVWLKHGGARLQYDALTGSIQMYTNLKMRRDPAAVTVLPPLYPQKRVVPRVSKKKSVKKPVAKNQTTPKAQSKVNPSPKPTLPKKDSAIKAPYTGETPMVAPVPTPNAVKPITHI